MGILISCGVILVITFFVSYYSMDDSDLDDTKIAKSIFVSICVPMFFLICAIPPEHTRKITERDYINALKACYVIESEVKNDVYDVKAKLSAINDIESYWEKRNHIKKKSESFWSGFYYRPESLEKYPNVEVNIQYQKPIAYD